MFRKHFDPIYISELVEVQLTYAHFHEGDEERHYNTEGTRGELERSYVEMSKYLDKIGKRKRSSSLHD